MKRRGFTLLETLVALAVTAVVLTALYGALGRAAAARARTTERADRLAVARLVLVRITRELEAALVPREPGAPERFVVVPPADDAPPWSELRFASADADLLAYRVRAEAVRAGTLVRSAASRFAAPDTGDPPAVPVVPRVARFAVRCFDGSEWRETWNVPALPRAVEITLGVGDGEGSVDLLATTVALPLAGS